jgi:hypothetical protein
VDGERPYYAPSVKADHNSALSTLASSGFAIGLNGHPNSCIFDAAGNLFVGMSDLNGGFGGGRLLKLDAGGLVTDTFYTDTEGRGTEWIDLAADQCTMFYTTASSSIKRHYVCDDNPGQPRGQLSDFCTSCSGSMGPFWGLRLLPDGGMIVADTNGMGPGLIRRYNASGMQVKSRCEHAAVPPRPFQALFARSRSTYF